MSSMVVRKFRKINLLKGVPCLAWMVVTESNYSVSIQLNRSSGELKIFDSKKTYHIETLSEGFMVTNDFIKEKLKFNGFIFPTENIYDVDYENFKNNETAECFQSWWANEGSTLCPEEGESLEEFTKRICGVAWNNK